MMQKKEKKVYTTHPSRKTCKEIKEGKKTKKGLREPLSSTILGLDIRVSSSLSILLFSRWIFRIVSNCYSIKGLREDNLYMPF